jgi:hypothetical protein
VVPDVLQSEVDLHAHNDVQILILRTELQGKVNKNTRLLHPLLIVGLEGKTIVLELSLQR